MKHNLTLPIDVRKYDNDKQFFDEAYNIFQMELQARYNRPNLFNKFIYIDEKVKYDNKPNGFWHISSIGEDDTKYDMYPCCNDITNGLCKYMCDFGHPENFLKDDNSIPCIYRACRIKWVREIIELANNNKNHPNLRIWQHKNQRTKEKTLKIRYLNGCIDYIIIFKISYKNSDIYCYRLKTAYPVVLKSYKKRFDREYNNYIIMKSKK
ncbi:hypothetical protein SAMN02745883_00677 [Caminicella sporogenes DSM 14501]|uniref:Uncharacterized protein n=1 Tax=Caminicella sporogenes DSM 14501 TaxID=1121266 RepID=A0A1M6MWN7_9FIRM|nr:hypothetical protein [Caminicella sporogenes]RKD22468.1 hypothetical protein BET04_05395 [Caminicella sporogenes]SHJ87832.1 hypothetical protein SAMN02745883_00677 [Caminicella sporogenes DSM 14501]